MPQGLQIFDASGNMTLDVTDRLTRVLGSFETGTTSGSITDDNLLNGTPWYYKYLVSTMSVNGNAALEITISGNTISWSFFTPSSASGEQDPINTKVIYGVF